MKTLVNKIQSNLKSNSGMTCSTISTLGSDVSTCNAEMFKMLKKLAKNKMFSKNESSNKSKVYIMNINILAFYL